MSPERVFRLILIAVFSAFSVIRILFYHLARKAGCRTIIEESRKYSILLSILICYEVFTFFVFVFIRDWLSWAHIIMPLWLRTCGAVLAFSALFLFLWVHLSLGRNFSIKLRIRDRQTMVTSGPYRHMRHPMYTAFYLLHLSTFFLTSNAFIGLTWTAGLTLTIVLRVKREEAMLAGHFGEEYSSYMDKTGRFLPPLRARGLFKNGKDAA